MWWYCYEQSSSIYFARLRQRTYAKCHSLWIEPVTSTWLLQLGKTTKLVVNVERSVKLYSSVATKRSFGLVTDGDAPQKFVAMNKMFWARCTPRGYQIIHVWVIVLITSAAGCRRFVFLLNLSRWPPEYPLFPLFLFPLAMCRQNWSGFFIFIFDMWRNPTTYQTCRRRTTLQFTWQSYMYYEPCYLPYCMKFADVFVFSWWRLRRKF